MVKTPEVCLDSSKENVDEDKVELEQQENIVEKKQATKPKKANKSKKKENSDEEEEDSNESKATLKYDKEEFKNPGNGKIWNFKISSWNVNGIRAWLGVF